MSGKKSTCFVAIKDDIINAGAEYSEERCVVDGNMYVQLSVASFFICVRTNIDHQIIYYRKGIGSNA